MNNNKSVLHSRHQENQAPPHFTHSTHPSALPILLNPSMFIENLNPNFLIIFGDLIPPLNEEMGSNYGGLLINH